MLSLLFFNQYYQFLEPESHVQCTQHIHYPNVLQTNPLKTHHTLLQPEQPTRVGPSQGPNPQISIKFLGNRGTIIALVKKKQLQMVRLFRVVLQPAPKQPINLRPNHPPNPQTVPPLPASLCALSAASS